MKKVSVTMMAIAAGILAGCSSGSTEGTAGAEENVHLVAATQLDDQSPYAVGLREFKEVVEEESDGSVTVEVHTNGSLGGSEAELAQSAETGSVDLVVASPGYLAQKVKEVDFFSILYLFEDREHWTRVVDGEVGDEVARVTEEKSNFKVLDYWSAGTRNYYGTQPVETPEDLENKTVRTQDSPVVTDTWQALGAQPTSVAWNEMYQALQNGLTDAAENDFTNIYLASHYEVADHLSLTEHDVTTRVFFTTQEAYDGMNTEQQEAVDTAVQEATETARATDEELASEYKQKLQEEGMEINEVDKEAFTEQTEDVRREAVENLGMEEEYERVQELKDE